jgi:OHCU decarboxylase
VERFGGVYEHSPWIAAAAHDAGLAAQPDTADELEKAVAVGAAKGTEDQKRSLILAHPDLAGKLALAGTLTAESTKEQASGGLDRLTADELARFASFNDAYRGRFGFPFIMAVKGKSKADIVAAFERRLANNSETETQTALAESRSCGSGTRCLERRRARHPRTHPHIYRRSVGGGFLHAPLMEPSWSRTGASSGSARRSTSSLKLPKA